MANPDLQIRGRGGGGYPDHEIRGGGGPVSKKFFSVPLASVWSKNKGGAGSPGPSPGSATDNNSLNYAFCFCHVFFEHAKYILDSVPDKRAFFLVKVTHYSFPKKNIIII